MSTKGPVDLYIAAYSDPAGAGRDWADLKRLEADGMIKLEGLVLVNRDQYGKIHVAEDTHDVRKGSLVGVVGGLVVGIIFPPSLLAAGLVGAGVGAGVGGLVSHHDKQEIKADVDEVLPTNSSGIVAIFEERWGERLDAALMNADVVKKEKIDGASAERLKTSATDSHLVTSG